MLRLKTFKSRTPSLIKFHWSYKKIVETLDKPQDQWYIKC